MDRSMALSAFKVVMEIPKARFHFIWDSRLIPEGPHDLTIRIIPHDGEPRLFGERRIFILHS